MMFLRSLTPLLKIPHNHEKFRYYSKIGHVTLDFPIDNLEQEAESFFYSLKRDKVFIHSSVVISSDRIKGWGMRCANMHPFQSQQEMKPLIHRSELIVSIPKDLWYRYSNAYAINYELRNTDFPSYSEILLRMSQVIPGNKSSVEQLFKHVALAVHISKLAQNKMDFNEYVGFLSAVRGQELPLIIHQSKLKLLEGSLLFSAINKRKNMYNAIAQAIFPNQLELQETFIWAMALLLSRAITHDIEGEKVVSFVPFIDLVNHTGQEALENAEHSLSVEDGSLNLVARKDIYAEDEILISYGLGKSSMSMMMLYGFLDFHSIQNSNDTILLQMDAIQYLYVSDATFNPIKSLVLEFSMNNVLNLKLGLGNKILNHQIDDVFSFVEKAIIPILAKIPKDTSVDSKIKVCSHIVDCLDLQLRKYSTISPLQYLIALLRHNAIDCNADSDANTVIDSLMASRLKCENPWTLCCLILQVRELGSLLSLKYCFLYYLHHIK